MKIYYRVSPFLSSNPNPMGNNKLNIVSRCFNSFKKSLTGQEVVIIADSLPKEMIDIFEGYELIGSKSGNIETFHKQLDLISKLPNEEKVGLVEDDYLWEKGCMSYIDQALDELSIISPYDHPGHYIEERFKHQPKRMRLINGRTYREAPSNTLTFFTKACVIKQNLEKIKTFGIRDHELFMSLEEDMFVPVPSMATHLVTGLLAPNVDWRIHE